MKILLYIVLFTSSVAMTAQGIEKSVDTFKNVNLAQINVQDASEGVKSPIVYLKLANGYYAKSNYTNAIIWYEKYLEINPTTNAIVRSRYKKAIKAVAEAKAKRRKLALATN